MKRMAKMQELIVNSNLSDVDKVRDFLKATLTDLKVSEETYFAIELSLMEICTNIVRYAYPEEKDKIFLKFWKENNTVFFEIRDNGIPFDPTEAKEPNIDKIIATEEVGGFGILIFRTLMDGFEYERKNNQNVLTLHKTISD